MTPTIKTFKYDVIFNMVARTLLENFMLLKSRYTWQNFDKTGFASYLAPKLSWDQIGASRTYLSEGEVTLELPKLFRIK